MVQGIGNKPDLSVFSGLTGGVQDGGSISKTKETTAKDGLRGLFSNEVVRKGASALTNGTPELENPTSKDSSTEIASEILSKLSKLTTADSGKGFYILIAILQLLQKAMNEMQKSMQVMRQAETNIAIANIEAEAAEMESAAKFAMWLGIASSAIQITGAAFSMAGGIKGVTSAAKGIETGKQMKATQQELTTLKANPEAPKADIEVKQMEYAGLKAKLDITTADGQARAARVQAVGQFIGSFAQLAKGIGDGVAGTMQSDAKRIEAQAKQMEESATKTADLVKGAKEMLTNLLNLMNSVAKNESETTAQILRGI